MSLVTSVWSPTKADQVLRGALIQIDKLPHNTDNYGHVCEVEGLCQRLNKLLKRVRRDGVDDNASLCDTIDKLAAEVLEKRRVFDEARAAKERERLQQLEEQSRAIFKKAIDAGKDVAANRALKLILQYTGQWISRSNSGRGGAVDLTERHLYEVISPLADAMRDLLGVVPLPFAAPQRRVIKNLIGEVRRAYGSAGLTWMLDCGRKDRDELAERRWTCWVELLAAEELRVARAWFSAWSQGLGVPRPSSKAWSLVENAPPHPNPPEINPGLAKIVNPSADGRGQTLIETIWDQQILKRSFLPALGSRIPYLDDQQGELERLTVAIQLVSQSFPFQAVWGWESGGTVATSPVKTQEPTSPELEVDPFKKREVHRRCWETRPNGEAERKAYEGELEVYKRSLETAQVQYRSAPRVEKEQVADFRMHAKFEGGEPESINQALAMLAAPTEEETNVGSLVPSRGRLVTEGGLWQREQDLFGEQRGYPLEYRG